MKKTKIICTIGPACDSPEFIEKMILEGMNVARLNFSHGSHAYHKKKIQTIRSISSKLNRPIAILQDLCGPKIRVGDIPDPGLKLNSGGKLTLTNQPDPKDSNTVTISYSDLPREVKAGDRILLADGLMEIVVEKSSDTHIYCNVITGGVLTSKKGVNLPTRSLKTSAFTPKDEKDLHFGIKNCVDYIALSFVRNASDVNKVKAAILGDGGNIPVIAKIEKHEAIQNLNDILHVADGIMIARGDLGVEIPFEKVPNIQKTIISKANKSGKPVIIATQMLRSMVSSPRPTRAETTDVANGVLDGADAIMLSEETASGHYPVEAVKIMRLIADEAEKKRYPYTRYLKSDPEFNSAESVAYAACVLAKQLNAAAIIATTRSGFTAHTISRFRPKSKILAVSPDIKALRRLNLWWGCLPCHVALPADTDRMIEDTAAAVLAKGLVNKDDLIVITAGRPVSMEGNTNMLWVKHV